MQMKSAIFVYIQIHLKLISIVLYYYYFTLPNRLQFGFTKPQRYYSTGKNYFS